MSKRSKRGKGNSRTPIRNAALLTGKKSEVPTENGEKKYATMVKQEQDEGRTSKAATRATVQKILSDKESGIKQQNHADREVGSKKENFIKKIIAEKNTPSPKVKEQKTVGKVESKKQVETPPKNELVLRLKASTSLSAPEKIQQNMKKDIGQQKGASRLTDSLKQGQNVKKAPPAKKPPTPGR